MKTCTVQTATDAVNRLAPKNLAEDWDNPGLLVGNPTAAVKKIFVCLDATDTTIAQAIDLGAELIVAHHPLIFHPIKNIRTDLPLGKKISRLIKNDVALFAAHTNLDSATGGVNDVLAKRLGLRDVKNFGDEENSLGRIGTLEIPMTAENFARHVKQALRAENVRLICAGDFQIRKVGICGGAGADFIAKGKFFGAQAFVTGDVKYHEAQAAVEGGIHVVDAGHFATEFPIVAEFADYLRGELKNFDVEIFADTQSADFFRTI